MNFAASLTRELQAQAEKAAEAAKNFKGFDEMAEEDTYIHSEGLNVKQTPTQSSKQQQSPQHRVDAWVNPGTEESPAAAPSTGNSWSLLDRLPRGGGGTPSSAGSMSSAGDRRFSPASSTKSLSSSQAPAKQQQTTVTRQQQKNDAAPRSQSSMPLLSVVADALEAKQDQSDGSSIGGDSNFSSTSDESSDAFSSGGYHTDSESDNEDNDPILSRMRGSNNNKVGPSKRRQRSRDKNGRRKQSRRNKKTIPPEMEQPSTSKKKKKGKGKNVHRFMDDLETAGETMSVTDFFSNQQQQSAAPSNALSNVKSWIQNPFQKLKQANDKTKGMAKALFAKKGPLSRPTSRNVTTPNASEQEDFQVKVSSTLLGDDELAQLAQLNQKNQPIIGKCCSLAFGVCRMVYQHPREAFIAFTMVLGTAVFFYARRQSNEDDVN